MPSGDAEASGMTGRGDRLAVWHPPIASQTREPECADDHGRIGMEAQIETERRALPFLHRDVPERHLLLLSP